MKIAPYQLVNALCDYIRNEVVRNIPDVKAKIVVGTAVNTISKKPEVVISAMEKNEVLSMLVAKDECGMYDIDALVDGIEQTVREVGKLEITIPAVPLIMPEEKVLTFSADDIALVKNYLAR